MAKVNLDKLIYITSTWAFTVDTNGNHQPYELREVKGKDSSVSSSWLGCDCYFPSVGMLLQWIVTTELARESDSGELENVKEYLTRFKEIATIYREINDNKPNKLGV